MAQVQGHCEQEFASLRNLLQANLDSGEELGTSLAVEIDGKLVVDLWGGYLDQSKTAAWEPDTIVNLFSTSKNACSLALLHVADRGLVDLDERVSTYWPEFATNGKEEVRVRHIMSHTSGVPAWEQPITLQEIYDVPSSAAKLATQRSWWQPGTASGYHALTHGHLISELIRRVTGKSLKQYIADELAQPLQADFQLGAVEADWPRVATIIPPPAGGIASLPKPASGSIAEKAHNAPPVGPLDTNTREWREAEFGAGNGHGNGRSIARILSPIVLDGVSNGKKFLSSDTIEQIFQEQAYGEDLVIGLRIRFGTGFGLPAKDTYWDWTPTGRVCGWGGFGGSVGIADIERRMTIGYAMNKTHAVGMGSPCTKAYVAEIYKVLGVEIQSEQCKR